MSELRQRKAGVPAVPASSDAPATGTPDPEPIDDKKAKAKAPAHAAPLQRDANGHYKAGMPSSTVVDRNALLLGPLVLVLVGFLAMRMLSEAYPLRYGICSRDGGVYITPEKMAECVVVNRDLVEFYGSIEETRSRFGDVDTLGSLLVWPGKASRNAGLKIYYLKHGRTVFPGFTDAHGHIMGFGHSLSIANLVGTLSKEEIIRKLIMYIKRGPKVDRANWAKVVEGHGFDQTKWPGGAFPTAADLDVGFLKNRKILLTRIDLHACWISPALLATLDVPAEIPGGVILRDEQGRPTGVFLDTASEWVQSQLPAWSGEDRIKYYSAAKDKLLIAGITGVHDAAMDLKTIDFFTRLDKRRLLPFKVYGMVACPKLDKFCGDQVEYYDGHHFTVRSAKLFLDGALGSWGAAMLEPYSDKPDEKGITRMSADTLRSLVEAWVAKGFQVNTHAIGDAANRIAIDVYEEILDRQGKSNKELRLRIEHAQILAPEDIERAGRLGLIASMQPTHGTSDMGYAESRLGPDRVKGAYAWQSFVKAGSPIALGSDFPVERISPYQGFHAAVTRLNATNGSPDGPGGWNPEERLTRSQALAGFTSGPAYARFAEGTLGSLEVGMKADITILTRDIMKVPAEDLRGTWARTTIVDGRIVHGKLP